jgi:CubicO group peptidase (beta-lactamase class C family)
VTLTTDSRFQPVADLFEDYLQEPDFSAQLSVRFGGELVVDLAAGPRLDQDSLTGVYSVSKGVAALVIARLFDTK